MFHHILGGLSPQGPTTLKRFFDLAPSGDEVNLRFPVTTNQQGQEMTTLVTMKRLSGERDMVTTSGPKDQGREVAISSRQSPDGTPSPAANRFVSFPPPL